MSDKNHTDETNKRKNHWNKIYEHRRSNELSWFQEIPSTSLSLIKEFNLEKSVSLIDVGGGDCTLVDQLIDLGYKELTVLDISENAINRNRKRLGEKSEQVNWVVSDILNFKSDEKYDLWHDRAVFHFLTDEEDIKTYINCVSNYIVKEGILILGTFSEDGPVKCSGLNVTRYSGNKLESLFHPDFKRIKCFKVDHITPSQTIQNFLFCCFKRQ